MKITKTLPGHATGKTGQALPSAGFVRKKQQG